MTSLEPTLQSPCISGVFLHSDPKAFATWGLSFLGRAMGLGGFSFPVPGGQQVTPASRQESTDSRGRDIIRMESLLAPSGWVPSY